VHEDGSHRLDGVLIRRLRWSVGYGPDTTAWLLRPAGVRRNLPGVLGMHCHGGVRSVGAEQLVELGPTRTHGLSSSEPPITPVALRPAS
jgi:hypothetical protein